VNHDLIHALDDLQRERGLDKETLFEALEAALVSAYRRHFGSAQNVKVNLDRKTGSIRVMAYKSVVEEVEDPSAEISLESAKELDPNYEVDDLVEYEVTPDKFGRIAAQTAKQVVYQRIREAERGMIYDEFVTREGDIITGKVTRVHARNAFIDLGRTEAVLEPQEQIPGERFRQGERIKAYIVEVNKTSKGPQIILSRTHPGLVKRLFELEVPEIYDGVVEIADIAREPGARTKVAVRSNDSNVDPVGACVGHRGMRVQNVVAELKGEKVDIVKWAKEEREYVGNALSPAKVIRVYLDPKERVARVVVQDNQLSLAIGKEGQNARLAAKLTGWRIDIKSESQMEELGEQFVGSGELVETEEGTIRIPDFFLPQKEEEEEGESSWASIVPAEDGGEETEDETVAAEEEGAAERAEDEETSGQVEPDESIDGA